MFLFKILTEKKMEKLGSFFNKIAKKGDVFALCGDLGTGKTSFVRGFVNNIDKNIKVKSPSFVLIREYRTDPIIYHCDMYRITSSEEAYNIGIEDCFDNGITFIEWADNISEIIPEDHIKIEFKYSLNSSRELKCYCLKEKQEKIKDIYEHFNN